MNIVNEKDVPTEETEKTEQAENEHNTDVKADFEAEKPEQSAAPEEGKSEQSAAPEEEKSEQSAAPEEEKPEQSAAPEEQKPEQGAEAAEPDEPDKAAQESGKKKSRGFLRFLKWFAILLLETLLLVAAALYGVMYVLAKGPSPTAAKLFVRSVNETSAIGFLSRLYFSEEEIEAMIAPETVEYAETKTELINIST